jgi:predicted nucleic acid-binding protein
MTLQLQLLIAVASIWVLVGATVLTCAALRAHARRRERVRRAREGDPLDTLVLQLRLGQMADELRRLASSPGFAAAHHTRAAQAAYDALLAEACRRAGLPVEGPARATEVNRESERLREELELASRGWTW